MSLRLYLLRHGETTFSQTGGCYLARDRLDCPAASLSVVKFGKYGPLLERMGDRAYMPRELRERKGT